MRLEISNLCKQYTRKGHSQLVLNDVSFSISHGAFVTLLGPSGCGKSTLLSLIAGLDRPTSGTIEIGGRKIFDDREKLFVPPGKRDISMVFQSYAIWPHMTVRENVEFPLKHGRKKWVPSDRDAAIDDALEKVRLTAFRDRSAPLLSGGQQQRVSLARAIAQRPSLMLLDEPLSNLDANLREAMQKEISGIVHAAGITAVYVTHDQKEALSMSDTVIVMNDGRIEQIGSPQDIYYRPGNRFVAEFMGSPNLLPATVTGVAAGRVHVQCALGAIEMLHLGETLQPGDTIVLVLKQEDFVLATAPATPSTNVFTLPILKRVFLGERMELICGLPDQPDAQLSLFVNARSPLPNDQVSFLCRPEEIHYFRER